MVTLLVRCLLVALFLPFSALDKLINYRAALEQATQVTPQRRLAAALIVGGLLIEVGGSLAILSGIADRLAALVLASYCIVTALLWKQFWRAADFRLRGPSRGRDTFWDFLKNLAVAGGFLLITFGPNAQSARRFWRDPLASTHPYTVASAEEER
jgi:putative oxidoreductase